MPDYSLHIGLSVFCYLWFLLFFAVWWLIYTTKNLIYGYWFPISMMMMMMMMMSGCLRWAWTLETFYVVLIVVDCLSLYLFFFNEEWLTSFASFYLKFQILFSFKSYLCAVSREIIKTEFYKQFIKLFQNIIMIDETYRQLFQDCHQAMHLLLKWRSIRGFLIPRDIFLSLVFHWLEIHLCSYVVHVP